MRFKCVVLRMLPRSKTVDNYSGSKSVYLDGFDDGMFSRPPARAIAFHSVASDHLACAT